MAGGRLVELQYGGGKRAAWADTAESVPMFQGDAPEPRPRLNAVLRAELLHAYQGHVRMVRSYLTPSLGRDVRPYETTFAAEHASHARAIAAGMAAAGEAVPASDYDFEGALRCAQWPDPRQS